MADFNFEDTISGGSLGVEDSDKDNCGQPSENDSQEALNSYKVKTIFETYKKQKEQEIADACNTTKLRTKYSKKVFRFMTVWSIVFGLILIFDAIGDKGEKGGWFKVETDIINSLCYVTSASVIGLVLIIVYNLFPSKLQIGALKKIDSGLFE